MIKLFCEVGNIIEIVYLYSRSFRGKKEIVDGLFVKD